MLNCTDLRNLTMIPRINDISLELLKDYYKSYLNPFIYNYTIAGNSNVQVRFEEENFCHLLGIESIVKTSINRRDLHNYRGINGWNNISNGVLTFDCLKKLNKNNFKDKKEKFVFFYLIPNLIETPKAIDFDNSIVIPATNIKSKFIFYDKYNSAYIHLGIEKSDKGDYYIPRTFLIEKITDKSDGEKYIKNQGKITVSKENRIILL